MKKLVALFLVIGFVAFVFGCSNGNSWDMIEDNPEPKTGVIDEHGRLPAPIRFDFGGRLETTEDNTLVKDVVVNVTETKSYDKGRNPIGNPEYIYIYGITAKLVDSLGNSTEVSSLEKPFKLTLPAGHLGTEGICYAGVREDKSSPWKYTRVSENGITTLSQRSIRASASGRIQPGYEFSLYRMGVEIALFVYNKPPEEAQKDISGAGITAAPATTVLTLDKDGNYLNDLDMDIKLAGDNLSGLKDSAITVSIIYRNKNSMSEGIKVNNQLLKPVTKSDEAVSGKNSYVHILTLDKSNFKALFGGETSINFTLNLDGISSSDFPADFIVEVSADNAENLIPFAYSQKVSCRAEAVYTIIYYLDGGSLAEGDANPEQYTAASESFTLKNPTKEDYTFAGWTGTDIVSDTASMTVTIPQGSTGNREYWAIWKQNAPDTYTITYQGIEGATFADGDNPTTYTVESEDITLKNPAKAGYTFKGWSGDGLEGDANLEVIIAHGSTGDKTYTANWTPVGYTIMYGGIEGATFADGDNPTTYTVESEDITLKNPAKAGYTFKGWSGDGLEGDANLEVIIAHGSTGDKTYTANWTPVSYTITYGGIEGATFADGDNPVTYDIASDAITLKNPTKAGYTFLGWTGTDIASDTASMTVTIPQGSTGNREYTASWSEIPSTITLDPQGGDLSAFVWVVDNKIIYTSASDTFNLPEPVKENYDFLGWTGTGIEEGTASMTVTIPQGSMGDRSYVASWTLGSVMTFNLAEGVELEMRRCPAGSFVRSGRGGYGDGNTVTITKDFYMGTYVVTNAQYVAIMGGSSPSSDSGADFTGDRQPVVNVSWNDIMDSSGFIAEMNSRFSSHLPDGYKFALPTEAQWEYACRAGTETDLNSNKDIENDYAFDSNTSEVAWYWQNWGESNHKTHDVGGLASNSFGLYDMHGNVWEWCADWYDDYDGSKLTDPTGPDTGSNRVMRGSSWFGRPFDCTSWFRNNCDPDGRSNIFGFRLALVPVQE